MRVCLIVNPRAGRGRKKLSEALTVFRTHGWELTLQRTTASGHATELAEAAADAGYDYVLGYGGDGTLREIVDGLVGTDIPIGILPGGTINLWTKEIGISTDIAHAAQQLIDARPQRVDVGALSINGDAPRNFLLMAGFGFDGAVMAHVSRALQSRIGACAVGLAGLKTIVSYRPYSVQITADAFQWQGRAFQLIVGNTRLYGGFAQMTPQACANDGLLDVCIIKQDTVLGYGKQLASFLLNKRPDVSRTITSRTPDLTITSLQPLPLQLDGCMIRQQPSASAAEYVYMLSAQKQQISLLIPRSYGGDLFQ